MLISSKWLISVAIVGGAATILAAALFWLLLTRPVAAAQVLGGAF
jgi:putative flippase GtrA